MVRQLRALLELAVLWSSSTSSTLQKRQLINRPNARTWVKIRKKPAAKQCGLRCVCAYVIHALDKSILRSDPVCGPNPRVVEICTPDRSWNHHMHGYSTRDTDGRSWWFLTWARLAVCVACTRARRGTNHRAKTAGMMARVSVPGTRLEACLDMFLILADLYWWSMQKSLCNHPNWTNGLVEL
jgi:hypothetical protein